MNTYPKSLKYKLSSMIKQMARSPDAFVKSSGKDFTRNRKLDFETLFKLILGMNGNTLKKEIYEHFNYDTSSLSTSAFCQQCQSLKIMLLNIFLIILIKQLIKSNFSKIIDYLLSTDLF